MTLLQALFLGTLQGLTEFLPVSSSGHLAIAQHFLPGFEQPGVLFDILLHVGTMVAVILFFWTDIRMLAQSPFRRSGDSGVHRKMLILLVVGSIPTAIIGLTFKDFFQSLFENLTVVSSMLLVTGTLLFISERFRRGTRRESQLTIADALVAGTAQAMAIIPGISRSGSTIASLLIKGVDGETAARFSFLLALPAVFGAAILSLGDIRHVATDQLPLYLAGTAAAFVAGYFSIRFLLAIIRRRRLFAFAIYCWMAGAFFLNYSL